MRWHRFRCLNAMGVRAPALPSSGGAVGDYRQELQPQIQNLESGFSSEPQLWALVLVQSSTGLRAAGLVPLLCPTGTWDGSAPETPWGLALGLGWARGRAEGRCETGDGTQLDRLRQDQSLQRVHSRTDLQATPGPGDTRPSFERPCSHEIPHRPPRPPLHF